MGDSIFIYYLIIESDSLHIMARMQCSSYNESRVGHIMEDAKATLSSIAGATIIRVRRQANGAIHRLAHYAVHSRSPFLWFDDPPDLIIDVLIEDCNSV